MQRRRLKLLQRIGAALMIAGALVLAGSEYPYLAGEIDLMQLLGYWVMSGMLASSGWILWRPWKTAEDEEYLEEGR